MSDTVLDGGAPAPADSSAVLHNDVINADNPIDARLPAKEPEKVEPEPKKAPSASDAVKQAMEKVKADTEAKAKEAAENAKAKVTEQEAKAKVEIKEPAPKPRDETGKFQPQQPKEQATQQAQEPAKVSAYRDAPSRFDDAAKAEWEKVPESVRGATDRALRELEQGIQKYKGHSDRYEQLREFDDVARQNGRDLKDSLATLLQIERTMAQNPIAGLEATLRALGAKKADGSPVTLLDVASYVMGQSPEERASQQNSTIAALQSQVAELTERLGGVSQTIQQQTQNATLQQVQEFASKPEHSRFDELSQDIGFFLETKRASTLKEAYELAERLNPGASNPEPLTPAPTAELAHTQAQARPLNPAGQKSIGGAPSASNLKPGKGRVMSNSEAIRIALQKVG